MPPAQFKLISIVEDELADKQGESEFTYLPWLLIGVVAMLILVSLHFLSEGMTSPFAAIGFFVSGPLIGVAIAIYLVLEQEVRKELDMSMIREGGSNFDIVEFGLKIVCSGLMGASLVALIAAIVKRDEWFNHLRRS